MILEKDKIFVEKRFLRKKTNVKGPKEMTLLLNKYFTQKIDPFWNDGREDSMSKS